MVNGSKESSHIAFENKTRSGIIPAHFSDKISQSLHRSVRPLSLATGIRVVDETFVKDGVKDMIDGMMHYSVAHRGLVNMPPLRIVDKKGGIMTMAIGFGFQLAMDGKKVVLKMSLKLLNIGLLPLAFLELMPTIKQILNTNNFGE